MFENHKFNVLLLKQHEPKKSLPETAGSHTSVIHACKLNLKCGKKNLCHDNILYLEMFQLQSHETAHKTTKQQAQH